MGLVFAILQGYWYCKDMAGLHNLMLHISLIAGVIICFHFLFVMSIMCGFQLRIWLLSERMEKLLLKD
ncbi:hypothetical protein BGX38DRAFT_780198 [Terfezia claveryi]|nr:hypothetical protein BGX38DRAFT_780198 [Terfezia claveryi]